MSEKKLSENLAELYGLAKSYIDSQITLVKIQFLEKTSRVSTFLISSLILIMAVSFALFFASFAFSYWYGKQYGNFAEGFLIAAAFYVVIIVILVIFRKQLIGNPVIRTIASILFKEDEKHETEED